MRVAFVPPSLEEYRIVINSDPLKQQRGGALEDIEIFTAPRRSLQGGGIFSLLSGLVKKVAPFVAKAVLPSALEFGQNVVSDLKEGNMNIKSTLKQRGVEALKATGRRLLTGKGRRKNAKRNEKKQIRRRKKNSKRRSVRYKDVFSSI